MGAGALRVDPADVAAAGATFDAAAEALARAAGALSAALPDVTQMCGDDAAGTRFAGAYRTHAEQLQDALRAIGTGLASVGPGLRTTATNISSADETSTVRTPP